MAVREESTRHVAKQVGAQTVKLRAESRGDTLPDLAKCGHPMDPIAALSSKGELQWDEELTGEIKKLATPRSPRRDARKSKMTDDVL